MPKRPVTEPGDWRYLVSWGVILLVLLAWCKAALVVAILSR